MLGTSGGKHPCVSLIRHHTHPPHATLLYSTALAGVAPAPVATVVTGHVAAVYVSIVAVLVLFAYHFGSASTPGSSVVLPANAVAAVATPVAAVVAALNEAPVVPAAVQTAAAASSGHVYVPSFSNTFLLLIVPCSAALCLWPRSH